MNHKFHENKEHNFVSYLTVNTMDFHQKDQPINGVWGNSQCSLWESCCRIFKC